MNVSTIEHIVRAARRRGEGQLLAAECYHQRSRSVREKVTFEAQ